MKQLALVLAAGLLAPAAPAAARSGPDSFAPLIRRILPAVVNISVTETMAAADDPAAANLPPALQRQLRERLGHRREQVQGAGSGFIIDPAGYIVTNNHVVGSAERIVVSLSDGTDLPAVLVGADAPTDIALIKIQAPRSLAFVAFGDSRAVEVGDWVLAAGNPFGFGGSITAGIVSARGRNIDEGPFDDFIQIDAPINPGNSGGPTFNLDGQVIAVNTAIVSPTGGSVGIGFAVPSEIAMRIVSDLRDKGRIDRGWLGVSVQDVQGGRAANNGVSIAGIDRTGPAARAGLRPGDVVTAVNGDRVDSARGLIRAVAAAQPGSAVKLSVRRGVQSFDLPVTVGRRQQEAPG